VSDFIRFFDSSLVLVLVFALALALVSCAWVCMVLWCGFLFAMCSTWEVTRHVDAWWTSCAVSCGRKHDFGACMDTSHCACI
jgi:hypothetical protein